MRRIAATLIATAVAVSALSAVAALPASAEPGDFDGAYGTCGYHYGSTLRVFRGGAVTKSGRTLELTEEPSDPDPVLRRFLPTGRRDATFGNHGKVELDGFGIGASMALDHQERIVVISRAWSTPAGVVERFLPNGQLDSGFNSGAGVSVPGSSPTSLAVTSDNGIVIVSPYELVPIAKVTTTGALDEGFRSDLVGNVVSPYTVGSHPDGGLIIVGQRADPPAGEPLWGVVRLAADGTPDPTYQFTTSLGVDVPADEPFEAAVDPLGRVVTIRWLANRRGSVMTRHQADGSIDPTFGDNGHLNISNSDTGPRDIRFEEDSSIEWIETLPVSGTSHHVPVIRRVTQAGEVDPEFGQLAGLYVGVDMGGRMLATNGPVLQYWGTFDDTSPLHRFRLRMDGLRAGAGLVLQWNGNLWPTRTGTDPGPECPYDTPYLDADFARGVTTVNGKGGYVVGRYGGINRFSIGLHRPRPPAAHDGPSWPGFDIARGIAARPKSNGGYVLDGFGGIHPFRTGTNSRPVPITNGPYWPGWDIARNIALLPNGKQGYVLDAYGGTHRFATPGTPLPPRLTGTPYWPGQDLARAIAILPDATGGYIVDAYGGVHPFAIGTNPKPPTPTPGGVDLYVPGEDWVRGFTFVAPLPLRAAAANARAARSDGTAVESTRRHGATMGRHSTGPHAPGSR